MAGEDEKPVGGGQDGATPVAAEDGEPLFNLKSITGMFPSGKEFKKKIYIVGGIVVVGMVIAFPFMQGLISAIWEKFIPPELGLLVALGPLDVMMLQLFLSVIFGVLAASPLIFYYLYKWGKQRLSFLGRFVNKRALLWWGIIGGIVFVIGLFYAYNYLVPPMFKFLLQISADAGITSTWRIGDFIWFAIMMILLLSLALEIPLIIFALVRSGILPLSYVIKGRRYFYLAMIIFSALFTSPDAITQLVTAVPVIIFVEITVAILKVVGPKKVPPDDAATGS